MYLIYLRFLVFFSCINNFLQVFIFIFKVTAEEMILQIDFNLLECPEFGFIVLDFS